MGGGPSREEVRLAEQNRHLSAQNRQFAERNATMGLIFDFMAKQNGQIVQYRADHEKQLSAEIAQRKQLVAEHEAELRKGRERCQMEMDQFKALLSEERANTKEILRNMDERQRRMDDEEQELKKEKAEMKSKLDMEAKLKTERYQMKTEAVVELMRREAKQKMGLDTLQFNVGVAGESGCGKSTFINESCQLAGDDPRAAKTGETECTTKMTKYVPDHVQNLALWDLPGAGTSDHPIGTYFYDKYLFMFDFLVIMYDTRFKEDDADLIRQAIAFHVPFVVVRTKAGQAFESRRRLKQHNDKTDDELIHELIDEIRQNTVLEMGKSRTKIDPQSVLVINAWALTDETGPRFQETELVQCVTLGARNKRS